MITNKPSRQLLVGLTASVALLLGGCGGAGNSAPSNPTTGNGDTPAGEPQSGGSITYGHAADPICVDPNQTDLTASRDIARTFSASTLSADPETGEIAPWLATDWTINDNATEFEFTFREDVTFSDGEEFNAEAFKTFLDGIKDLGGRAINASSYIEGYAGTEVTGDYQAKVTFDTPNASFLQALTTVNMAVLSPSTYTSVSPEERCLGNVAGAGPFVIDSFVPAQEVVVVKREGYAWSTRFDAHEGEAYLDQITFRIVPESTQRAGGLRSNTLDGINVVAPQDEPVLESAGYTVFTANNPGTVSQYLTNNSKPTLSDPAVRKAIQLGLNNEEVRDTLLLPRVNVATSVLSSTTPLYTDFSDYLYHDPDEARAILDAAGWVPGSDGVRVKDGVRLSVEVLNGQSGPTSAHELRAQQLADIGVELTIKQTSRAEMLAALDSGDYDFVPYGFTRADAAALDMHFTTKRNNPLHLEPSELDDYLDAANAASNAEDRQAAVDQAAQYIVENNLVIVFNEQSQAHAFSPKLHGIRWEPGVQISYYDAWLEQ